MSFEPPPAAGTARSSEPAGGEETRATLMVQLTEEVSVRVRTDLDVADRERRAVTRAEARVAAAVERDADAILKDMLSVVLAPGRAGVGPLERLTVGR